MSKIIIPESSNVTFIDPGLGGTGWAHFGYLNKYPKVRCPDQYGVIRGDKHDESWEHEADTIAYEVGMKLSDLYTNILVVEFPSLWASGKSQAAAIRGDLFKLSYLIGCIMQESRHLSGIQSRILISPQDWKGQLSKEMVLKRINTYMPGVKIPNHAADAVGMGLSAQGCFEL